MLSDRFAIHGYPHVMVSDNATIFSSSNRTLDRTVFSKKFIAPGHPATNGFTECNVQTLKTQLKAMANEPFLVHTKVRKTLF
jgi:hypothetical protein